MVRSGAPPTVGSMVAHTVVPLTTLPTAHPAPPVTLALAPAEPDDFRPATGSQDHRTLTTDPRENKGRRRPAVD